MRRLLLSLGCLCVAGGAVRADDSVSSPPMGYVQLNLHGRTDNLIAIPLLQEPISIGHVLTVTANTLQLDTGGWTADQFAPAPDQCFYAEISSGKLNGVTYRITGNTADTLTLDTGIDDLTQHRLGPVGGGSTVRIRPAWTVGAVFGSSSGDLSLASFDSLPTALQADSGDSLLFFDPAALGIEKVPTTRLVYVESTGWRAVDDATTERKDYPLLPLTPILVRLHGAGGVQIPLLGDAYLAPGCLHLPGGNGTQANDAFLGVASSEPVALNDLDLVNEAPLATSVVKTSPSATQREDLLLAFNPSRAGYERGPEHTYFYLTGSGWREVGTSSTTIGSDVLLNPGLIYVLRKRAGSTSRDWAQNPHP